MDFAIIYNQQLDMSFVPVGDISNNITLSLAIIKGTWWFNPDFGMRDTRRLKNTEQNARLVKRWAEEALKWILDSGAARAIEVYVEHDRLQDPTRLKLLVEATQADGRTVTYETFKEVV